MRKLASPVVELQGTYSCCVSSIADVQLRSRLEFVYPQVSGASTDYIVKARQCALHEIQPVLGQDDVPVVEDVTKGELKGLYTSHMVPKKKPARQIYDEILVSANGRCPICGIGEVSTLDHYLPKNSFPIFSVLPSNLVPACKDCNHTKGESVCAAEDEQCLHPYFDPKEFYDRKWLHAEVVAGNPPVILYYVDPPNNWSQVQQNRVRIHFSSYELGKRFSLAAADELSTILGTWPKLFKKLSIDDLSEHCLDVARHQANPNTWKAAMYESLSSDEWFLGFI